MEVRTVHYRRRSKICDFNYSLPGVLRYTAAAYRLHDGPVRRRSCCKSVVIMVKSDVLIVATDSGYPKSFIPQNNFRDLPEWFVLDLKLPGWKGRPQSDHSSFIKCSFAWQLFFYRPYIRTDLGRCWKRGHSFDRLSSIAQQVGYSSVSKWVNSGYVACNWHYSTVCTSVFNV